MTEPTQQMVGLTPKDTTESPAEIGGHSAAASPETQRRHGLSQRVDHEPQQHEQPQPITSLGGPIHSNLTAEQQTIANALGINEAIAPLPPKVRDAEHHPKAFPSTYQTPLSPTHLKERTNAHGMASGKIGHKSIQEIGGKYGGRQYKNTSKPNQ